MIYERKAKDVVVEKKREVLAALWEATSGLGEVICLLSFLYSRWLGNLPTFII